MLFELLAVVTQGVRFLYGMVETTKAHRGQAKLKTTAKHENSFATG